MSIAEESLVEVREQINPEPIRTGINASVLWLGAIHVVALAGVLLGFFPFRWNEFLFHVPITWESIVLTFVLAVLTGHAGICVGFHRMLTHRGFETFPVIKYTYALFGTLAGEGSPANWIAKHRVHHEHSDVPGFDPHTPREGASWAHFFWLTRIHGPGERKSINQKYAADILKDPVLWWMGRLFLPLQFVMMGVLFAAGYLYGGLPYAFSFLIWGMFVRMVAVFHVTWSVNSLTHMYGYQNYETGEDSKNNWFVALTAAGEGWHNNHHADPPSAVHGHKWWEFDASYCMWIRPLEMLGLAWNVKKPDWRKLHKMTFE